MKNKFYMKEFLHFNGEDFVTFNILDIDELKHKSYGESLRFDGFHEYDGGIIEIR